MADGAAVQAIVLRSETLTVRVLTLGAIVQSVRLDGVAHDLTISSQSVADYQGAMCYYGSIIAPVVNRITGGAALVAGQMAQFEKNIFARHTLHSGAAGTQFKLWHLDSADATSAVLSLRLAHGEGGFAGNRIVQAVYTLTGDTLRLDISVISDAPTIWNAANHSYWNLDGSADFSGHSLRIAADHILPLTDDLVPTGAVDPVAGGPYDFRASRPLAPCAPDLDTNFCLSRSAGDLRNVLTLRGASGVTLRLFTTEAGLQVYDCRHDGHRALAFEAQGWPDAPNHSGFPSIALAAGVRRVQSTSWQLFKGQS
jgi:aldose 1-epimerase